MFFVLKEVDIILKKQVFKKILLLLAGFFIFQDAVTIWCTLRVQFVKQWTQFHTEKFFIVKLKHNLQSCCDKNGKHIDG